MYQYVNGFSCAASNDGNEISLRFFQMSPQYANNGDFESTVTEEVAKIVMTDSCAKLLFNHLKSILEPEGN